MIECEKCGALNSKESAVCGSCGVKLKEHEGVRPIKIEDDEKVRVTTEEKTNLILSAVLFILYFISGNELINTILGFIGLYIARRRNSVAIEIISWLSIGWLIGQILLALVMGAWGF